jgi:hypothetical protein
MSALNIHPAHNFSLRSPLVRFTKLRREIINTWDA